MAEAPRIGADPDGRSGRPLAVGIQGTSRVHVEHLLGKPIASETLADGRTRAVYEYTVREGKSRGFPPTPEWKGLEAIGATALLIVEAVSFGTVELILMPWAVFSKAKRTYQKEYVYAPDGTIVESSPEHLKPAASN